MISYLNKYNLRDEEDIDNVDNDNNEDIFNIDKEDQNRLLIDEDNIGAGIGVLFPVGWLYALQ